MRIAFKSSTSMLTFQTVLTGNASIFDESSCGAARELSPPPPCWQPPCSDRWLVRHGTLPVVGRSGEVRHPRPRYNAFFCCLRGRRPSAMRLLQGCWCTLASKPRCAVGRVAQRPWCPRHACLGDAPPCCHDSGTLAIIVVFSWGAGWRVRLPPLPAAGALHWTVADDLFRRCGGASVCDGRRRRLGGHPHDTQRTARQGAHACRGLPGLHVVVAMAARHVAVVAVVDDVGIDLPPQVARTSVAWLRQASVGDRRVCARVRGGSAGGWRIAGALQLLRPMPWPGPLPWRQGCPQDVRARSAGALERLYVVHDMFACMGVATLAVAWGGTHRVAWENRANARRRALPLVAAGATRRHDRGPLPLGGDRLWPFACVRCGREACGRVAAQTLLASLCSAHVKKTCLRRMNRSAWRDAGVAAHTSRSAVGQYRANRSRCVIILPVTVAATRVT